MKQKLAFAAILLTLGVPLLMQANETFYVGAQGGVNFLDCRFLTKRHCVFDTGYNVGIVGGYFWCDELRLEAEVSYHDNDYRLHGINEDGNKDTFHGNVDTWSFMANTYFDIPLCLCEIITPYIGVGIGFDCVHQKIKIDGENYKGSNTGFAWQVMGGTTFYLFEDVDLTVEYETRYITFAPGSPIAEPIHHTWHKNTILLFLIQEQRRRGDLIILMETIIFSGILFFFPGIINATKI